MTRAYIGLATVVLVLLGGANLPGAPADPNKPQEILKRCSCVSGCGTCAFQRCCGDSVGPTPGSGLPGPGKVCVEGDKGDGACRDFLDPMQFALALDGSGNLFAASNGTDSVFRITPGGCVTRVLDDTGDRVTAVDGARGLSVDGDGNLYVASGASGKTVFRVAPDGTRTKLLEFTRALATAVDTAHNVYVTAEGTDVVRMIPGDGSPAVNLIDGGVPVAGKKLLGPRGIAVGVADSVYVAGETSDTVFKIAADRTRSVILDAEGDSGGNTLDGPFGVATHPSGDVFVTGFNSDNVFRIASNGAVSQIFAKGPLDGPREIATDAAGNVYVTGRLSANVIRLAPGPAGVYSSTVLIQGEPETPGSPPTIGPQNANLLRARSQIAPSPLADITPEPQPSPVLRLLQGEEGADAPYRALSL